MATAFVLTIGNATTYVIHPIIPLGLNHKDIILYPIEDRLWARTVNEKWQTINLESCITRGQQGFICEGNTIDAQDIRLNAEQNLCHFEIHPNTDQKTVIIYIGHGCIYLRTTCTFLEIDGNNVSLPARDHSNFCICNFIRIIGCDFSYLVPTVSHQLIKSNYTTYYQLLPTHIGMNLTLVKQLMNHEDPVKIAKEIQENGQKMLTVQRDTKKVSRVLQRVKQDTSHNS